MMFLKLISYIHFWYDVRMFRDNKARLMKEDPKKLQETLYDEIEEVIDKYPSTLKISDLLTFLMMPILCFQYKYPRTERVRKRLVLLYAGQFLLSGSLCM